VQQDVGRLERLDAPDDSSTTASGGTPSLVRARVASPGRKCSRSTPGGDRDHAVDLGAVRSTSSRALVGSVRDQAVGGLDDLLLADDAAQRLRRVPFGEREVLDLARVCAVCTSGTPQRSEASPADLPGQPVVGVHDVVPARLVRGLGPQHAGGQRAQLGRQVLLGEPLEGAGGDVPDGDAGGELDDRREVAGGGPGEDLDRDAEAASRLLVSTT
jgi:hypothetical protein